MDHCGLGKVLGITDSSIDPLTALEQWVEEGDAPESLMMTKLDPEGNVIWGKSFNKSWDNSVQIALFSGGLIIPIR